MIDDIKYNKKFKDFTQPPLTQDKLEKKLEEKDKMQMELLSNTFASILEGEKVVFERSN